MHNYEWTPSVVPHIFQNHSFFHQTKKGDVMQKPAGLPKESSPRETGVTRTSPERITEVRAEDKARTTATDTEPTLDLGVPLEKQDGQPSRA